MSVCLNAQELQLFAVFLAASKVSGSVVRVAGGWVRDKLLGLPSDDIDIALDNISGVEFANIVKECLSSCADCAGLMAGSIGTIAANPEQSKHLETATMRIGTLDIDFVNLRSETYVQDSRIPEIKCGTAREDARRRDFTVNSLFYNLNESKVEDMTGRGMNDLATGTLSTPLDPYVTFLDDPLRVLRAIRFAARYRYRLTPELEAAARNADIKRALFDKVSRERVLKEVDGMLQSSHDKPCRPLLAFSVMRRLDVFDCVIVLPPGEYVLNDALVTRLHGLGLPASSSSSALESWQQRSLAVVFTCSVLVSVAQQLATNKTDAAFHTTWQPLHIRLSRDEFTSNASVEQHDIIPIDEELLLLPCFHNQHKSLYLAAAAFGLCHLNVLEKRKLTALSTVSLRDGLKADNETVRQTAVLLDSWSQFAVFSKQGCSRVEGGLLIRRCQALYRESLLLACAFELAASLSFDPASFVSTGAVHSFSLHGDQIQILQRYRRLQDELELSLGLDECWCVSPLLDGNQLMEVINVKRGPAVGAAMEEQVKWQLQFPNGTHQELTAHLTEFAKSLSTFRS
jgi:tRNA nucleotidyltransferase/poly(A) polymerase